MYESEMSFKEAYRLFWKNALDIKSRARRKEYWGPLLINYLVYFVLVLFFIGSALVFIMTSNASYTSPVILLLPIFYFSMVMFNLIMLIPNLTVTIRRFHDVGYSGWMLVIIFGVSMVIGIVMGVLLAITDTPNTDGFNGAQLIIFPIFMLLLVGMSIWVLITTMRDSQAGINKWGPNPKEVTPREMRFNDRVR